MIRAVDEALRNLLEREVGAVTGLPVRVVLAPPPDDRSHADASGPRAPAASNDGAPTENDRPEDLLSLFLYDVRENTSRREDGRRVERSRPEQTGTIRQPPVFLDLSYVVSVQATAPDREHALLAEVLGVLIRRRVLDLEAWIEPGSETARRLAELHDLHPFPMKIAQPEVLPDPVRFWQALGRRPRAGFSLLVTAAFEPHPPVVQPLVTHTILGMPHDPRTEGVTPRVVQWVALAGTVTTPEGAPLAGARVHLVGRTQATGTDDRGFYYFLNLPPGEYQVRALSGGRSSATQRVPVVGLPGGGYATADLVLAPAVLTGTVTRSPGSRPVPHVAVRAGAYETFTDAEGYFAFGDLPAGEYEVRAAAPGHGEQQHTIQLTGRPGDSTRVDLLLYPPALSGSVSDRATRAGIRGAAVEVSGHGRVVTDARGYYSLPQLPPGRYRVVAEADGYRTAEQFLQLQPPRPTVAQTAAVVMFELEPAGSKAAASRAEKGRA